MKKNILLRTNVLICLIIVVGFALTAALSYRANYSSSLKNIEQVSTLTSEGIYYQMSSTFTKPVNVSLTIANDSLLKDLLSQEEAREEDEDYIKTIKEYLRSYQKKYDYDSVFLVSDATKRYYNYNGLDRVLTSDNEENTWYYDLLKSDVEYAMNVDNDEVVGAENQITVFVNCKIKDKEDRIMGVVGVGLRIGTLQQLLKGYLDEYGVQAYFIDEQGTIQISGSYTGHEAVHLMALDQYSDKVMGEILGWREAERAHGFWTNDLEGGGKNNYIMTRYLPELDWHLVVERDSDSFVRELHLQMVVTTGVIAAIIVVILIVITNVIRNFNRQIVSLTQSIEQDRRSMFEKATEQLFENIYELDITHNCPADRVTAQYFESLGAPPDTPYDKSLHIVAEKQIKEEFRQGYIETFTPENVLKAYREGKETLRYDFMTANGGDYYWMRIIARIVPFEGDGSIHMLVYRQNIDAEKRQEKRMLFLAQTDEMTGILTKTATQHGIERILRKEPEQAYAFFIFDIDNFKQVNDQRGHAFGDQVIMEFVSTIQKHFRKEDLLGRIGGDEFAAFVPILEDGQIKQKAEELSVALDRQYGCDGDSWHITASIGISLAPRDGKDFESLYKKADKALYMTKKHGKNGYTVYGEQMT